MQLGPNIFSYENYRVFLRDVYQYKKSTARGYSYRSFSKSAGLSSPNYLKLVIDGQRNLGHKTIPAFTQALKLNKKSSEFFSLMVELTHTEDTQTLESIRKKMSSLQPHSQKRELAVDEQNYLQHWLYPVIREMIELGDFHEDPHWIARRLHYPAKISDISKCVAFLVSRGFIEKKVDGTFVGTFVCCDPLIASSDEIRNVNVRHYHQQQLSISSEILNILDIDQREFGALVLSIPESELPNLKKYLKEFRDSIHDWSTELCQLKNEPKTIVQLNFQMYPHNKKKTSRTCQ